MGRPAEKAGSEQGGATARLGTKSLSFHKDWDGRTPGRCSARNDTRDNRVLKLLG